MNTENEERRALIARLVATLCVPLKNFLRIYEACDCRNDVFFSFLKTRSENGAFRYVWLKVFSETTEKDPYGEGFLQYHQAHVLARSQPAEARLAVERAVELFEKLGAAPMVGKAKKMLARLPEAEAEATGSEPGGQEIADDKIDAWFDSMDK